MNRSRGRVVLLLLALLGLLAPPALAQDWEWRVCADPADLPYTNAEGEGFENRIAEILAEELGATLRYEWRPQRGGLALDALREGACDAVLGVADGDPRFQTTLSYYRSSYVFVRRSDADFEVTSLDDAVLRELRIGVHLPAGGGAGATPPAQALARRGLASNLVGFTADAADARGDAGARGSHAAIVEAVARGDVGVAVAWGPAVGRVAAEHAVALDLAPVRPEFDLPYLPMTYSVALGVRRGDAHFAELLDRALAARWDEIRAVLEDHHVPLLPLPRPAAGGGG